MAGVLFAALGMFGWYVEGPFERRSKTERVRTSYRRTRRIAAAGSLLIGTILLVSAVVLVF